MHAYLPASTFALPSRPCWRVPSTSEVCCSQTPLSSLHPCPCRRCLANTPRPSQPLTKWSRATKPDSLRCKTTSITPKYKSSTTSTCSCARGTPHSAAIVSGLPHHSRVPSRNIIRHHVIFTTNCTCEPFNKHACPRYLSLPRRPHVSSFLFTNAVSHFVRIGCSDLHELISPRLPNELYFLLCQGGILPQVVNNLLSGALLEAPPLVPARQGDLTSNAH